MEKYNIESVALDVRELMTGGMVVLMWTSSDLGYGEITLRYTRWPKPRLELHTETMSKDFVKAVFNKLVDDAEVVG